MIKNKGLGALLCLAVACGKGEVAPLEYQGVVEFEETTLAFEVPGRIAAVLVNEGDPVALGQPIATVSDSVEQTLLKAKEAELAASRSQSELVAAGARPAQIRALRSVVAAARANYAQLERQLAREKTLFAQNVSTQERIDQVETQMLMAKANLEQRQAELLNLELGSRKQEVEGARKKSEALDLSTSAEKQRLDKYTLVSPLEGTVLDVHVDPGELARAGTPVVTVARKGEQYVEVFVPQNALAGVSVGRKANVFVDAETKPFVARVKHIARTTEVTPRYIFSATERSKLVVRVRLEIEDPKNELHAGVPARATFL